MQKPNPDWIYYGNKINIQPNFFTRNPVNRFVALLLFVSSFAFAGVDTNTKWDDSARCEVYATAAVYNVQPQREEGVLLKVALKHELDSLIPEFAPSAVPTTLIQEVTYATIFVYQNLKLKDNDLYLSYVFTCKNRLAPHSSI